MSVAMCTPHQSAAKASTVFDDNWSNLCHVTALVDGSTLVTPGRSEPAPSWPMKREVDVVDVPLTTVVVLEVVKDCAEVAMRPVPLE